jgi:polyhydroxybutyrate depolymerase
MSLAWHGISSSPDDAEKKFQIKPQADAHGFLVVFPEAQNRGGGLFNPPAFNGAGCCKDDTKMNEAAFAQALTDQLVQDGCVDATRVFSFGYSNGGFTTHRLACEAPSFLAAGAIHSGTYGDYSGNLANSAWKKGSCGSGSTPMIGFMGDQDSVVPFRGGRNPSPLGSAVWDSWYGTFDVWQAQNNCGAATSSTFSESGSTVNRTTWANCDVEQWTIAGMGHDWWVPSTAKIVAFFKGHGL